MNDNSLNSSCGADFSSDLDPEFVKAIAQFNGGEYYNCHDTLEEIWHNAWQSDRAFYQGILQIAVGLYHLYNHNWNGAVILLGEGTSRLPMYLPEYMTINVEILLDDSLHLLKTLQQSGKERLPEMLTNIANGDLQLPVIKLISGAMRH